MASNKFCPALVDRKPMLLPTHDFLAQIVAPKWYLAGLHSNSLISACVLI